MTTTASATLEISLSRSRSLEALYGALGALALASLLCLSLSIIWRLIFLVIFFMWLWTVLNQLRFLRQIEAVRLSDAGVSVLWSGVWWEVALRKNYFVAPFAVMFSGTFVDKPVSFWRKTFFPKHFVIFPDAVPSGVHRKIRVWFKSYASREKQRETSQGEL